jgi:hypothetical protein
MPMTSPRNIVDRVRPFLRAMEDSIAAARQQRLSGGAEPEPAPPSAPARTENPPVCEPAARLRARPKRPSSFLTSCEEPRAQRAG